jgi:hypothetical protein
MLSVLNLTIDQDDLLGRIRENGGITVSLVDGSTPHKGFAVSVPGHEVQCRFVLTARDLQAYIRQHATALAIPGAHLGAWWDGEADTWYLDVSLVVGDQATANKLGAEWNQKAIFDLQSGLALHVPQWLNHTLPEVANV